MERIRQEGDVSRILNSALDQVESYDISIWDSLVDYIFSLNPQYPPNIQKIINDKREEAAPRIAEIKRQAEQMRQSTKNREFLIFLNEPRSIGAGH